MTVAAFAGCTPGEKLDLADYPTSQVSQMMITDLVTPVNELPMTAAYDAQGKLSLAGGVLSHTYTVKLDRPSPEAMTLFFEPALANVPASAVTLDKTSVTIEAGYQTAQVTLTMTDESFIALAEPDVEAKTYEIGVRVASVSGNNAGVIAEGVSAKVTVVKDAYVSTLTVAEAAGREKTFNYVYKGGALSPDTEMTHTFKVTLDRVSKSDVKVAFTMDGLPEGAAWSVSPTEAVIPAGEFESGDITVTVPNDFMLEGDPYGEYLMTLAATISSADATVVVGEGVGAVTLAAYKGIVEALGAIPSTWTKYSTAGWGATAALIDGNVNTYYFNGSNNASFTFDMKEVRNVVGIVVRPAFNVAGYNLNYVETYVSEDGAEWTWISSTPVAQSTAAVLQTTIPVSTRYLALYVQNNGQCATGEVEVYGSAE
jgi:hypothetical protein